MVCDVCPTILSSTCLSDKQNQFLNWGNLSTFCHHQLQDVFRGALQLGVHLKLQGAHYSSHSKVLHLVEVKVPIGEQKTAHISDWVSS